MALREKRKSRASPYCLGTNTPGALLDCELTATSSARPPRSSVLLLTVYMAGRAPWRRMRGLGFWQQHQRGRDEQERQQRLRLPPSPHEARRCARRTLIVSGRVTLALFPFGPFTLSFRRARILRRWRSARRPLFVTRSLIVL
jgi:hypothetical protein